MAKFFTFRSSYYGSHGEFDGDRNDLFLFAEHVDLSRWEGVEFSHGTFSQRENNDEWDEWLEGLEEGVDYLEEF